MGFPAAAETMTLVACPDRGAPRARSTISADGVVEGAEGDVVDTG
jgi:hypothetical protein